MASLRSFGTYLKAAFWHRWNMLLFSGAVIASFIGPNTDITLPLVAAAEIAFLALAASNPRFQRAVDAKIDSNESIRDNAKLTQRFNDLYYGLDPDSQQRFNVLRQRCQVLLFQSDPTQAHTGNEMIASSQTEGVNRLLWVFLKLLHTRTRLERFFESTEGNEIDRSESELKKKLAALPTAGDDILEKKRASLQDTLNTVTARKDNLKRAKDNFEYVNLELERIATKLTTLSEMAVNRQDPSTITSGVDDVARSIVNTEQAIGDLQIFTGLTEQDVAAPQIIVNDRVRARV